jgi:Patatin-like phospholipase
MANSSRSPGSIPAYPAERQRAQDRRAQFGIRRPEGQGQFQWALALSGGGIRSATFCLGVLQGLARGPGPTESDPAHPLLDQFDYLSTVSGGGYIGSFLSSLYVPGRVSGDAGESDDQAARRVAQVLREDPPGRMHRAAKYDKAHPGRTALAWLRDNGRYLAPSGAGDYLYGAGLALRNWVATQYVVGTAICLAMAVIALLRWTLIVYCPFMSDYEQSLLDAAAQSNGIWWSTLWWLCAPVLLLAVLPLGVGYWFSYTDQDAGVRDVARPFTKGSTFGLLLGVLFVAVGLWADPEAGLHTPINYFGLGTGLLLLTACVWYRVSYSFLRNKTVSEQRVLLTRWLTTSLTALLLFAAVAAIDTLSQTVQLNFDEWKAHLLASGTLMAAIVWIARALVEARSEKSSPDWLAKIPVGVLAFGGGLILWLLVATGWHLLVHTMIWNSVDLRLLPYDLDVWQIWQHAAAAVVVCFVLALIVGLFPGFLNLSTLQGLYSARLTRSYLGASNHERFARDFPAARSVAEPIKNDGLPLEDIYRNPYAPMHLINVCVNQTVDPAEQLVQRDRKGKPLLIAPNGFYLDGEPHAFTSRGANRATGEVASPLTLGEWIGVSGAAFTTGLGRGTNLGMSLLLGFANVRLGRWWASGVPGAKKDRALRRVFKTQAYLLDEIKRSFYGTSREYQYLSDGGHFENTAVYELLRRDRQIRLIVVCDCGCDPTYRFGDLANLMRLARIDQGLELRVNEQVADDPVLGAVFGRPGDLTKVETDVPGGGRCALLVDVVQPPQGDASEQLAARIIVLKPRLIDGVPLDVANYQSQHPSFPQEPTGDQFYDEAQWESYRKLGLTIALRVFPQDATSAFAQAFWRKVLG